jgi:hypothetical protein
VIVFRFAKQEEISQIKNYCINKMQAQRQTQIRRHRDRHSHGAGNETQAAKHDAPVLLLVAVDG